MVDALATSFTIKDDDGAGDRIILDGRNGSTSQVAPSPRWWASSRPGTAAQRPQPTANTSKKGRDSFWDKVVAIWIDIGGEATSGHAQTA